MISENPPSIVNAESYLGSNPYVAHLLDPLIVARVDPEAPGRNLHLHVWPAYEVTEPHVRRIIKNLLLTYQAAWEPDNVIAPPSQWEWSFVPDLKLPPMLYLWDGRNAAWSGVLCLAKPLVLFSDGPDGLAYAKHYRGAARPSRSEVEVLQVAARRFHGEFIGTQRIEASPIRPAQVLAEKARSFG